MAEPKQFRATDFECLLPNLRIELSAGNDAAICHVIKELKAWSASSKLHDTIYDHIVSCGICKRSLVRFDQPFVDKCKANYAALVQSRLERNKPMEHSTPELESGSKPMEHSTSELDLEHSFADDERSLPEDTKETSSVESAGTISNDQQSLMRTQSDSCPWKTNEKPQGKLSILEHTSSAQESDYDADTDANDDDVDCGSSKGQIEEKKEDAEVQDSDHDGASSETSEDTERPPPYCLILADIYGAIPEASIGEPTTMDTLTAEEHSDQDVCTEWSDDEEEKKDDDGDARVASLDGQAEWEMDVFNGFVIAIVNPVNAIIVLGLLYYHFIGHAATDNGEQ